MYKFLIFDADHTLYDFDRAEKNAIIRIMTDIGHQYDDALLNLYKNINISLWEKFERNEITQSEIKKTRFRLFFEQSGIRANPNKAAEDFLLYLSQGNYIIPGADEIIYYLKETYLLGLLSNGISKVQHPRLENSVFCDAFDAVVISGDVGINKPDPRIFEILTKKAGFYDKKRMLMIGDSLTSDMLGGINFGIDTCWYNPGLKKNTTSIKPNYEIADLTGILKILERDSAV